MKKRLSEVEAEDTELQTRLETLRAEAGDWKGAVQAIEPVTSPAAETFRTPATECDSGSS